MSSTNDPPTMAEPHGVSDPPPPRPRRALPILNPAPPSPPLADQARPIDGAFTPNYAVWELTLACDLACRHCGSRAGRARPDELTTEQALDLVRQLAELGVREVTLIGGEAYLHAGWLDVIAEIRRCAMQCTLVTGGRRMTRERATAAAGAGLQSVAVSIDGGRAAHDRLRGVTGSYDAALNAIRNCRSAGIQVAVNTQVNRVSLPDLMSVFELLLREGARGWQVQLTVPAGRAADEPEMLLQPYELLALFPLLGDLKERCDRAGVVMFTGNTIGYFGPYEHRLRSHCRSQYRRSCSAGLSSIGIESNGDVKGCPSLPTDAWVGGNVKVHRLRDVWERSAALRHMRDRTRAELWGYCAECYYADECRAGCTWMATSLFGAPGNNPYCHHRALEMRRQGKRERIALAEPAPGLPFDHGRWRIVVETEPDAAFETGAERETGAGRVPGYPTPKEVHLP